MLLFSYLTAAFNNDVVLFSNFLVLWLWTRHHSHPPSVLVLHFTIRSHKKRESSCNKTTNMKQKKQERKLDFNNEFPHITYILNSRTWDFDSIGFLLLIFIRLLIFSGGFIDPFFSSSCFIYYFCVLNLIAVQIVKFYREDLSNGHTRYNALIDVNSLNFFRLKNYTGLKHDFIRRRGIRLTDLWQVLID